MKIERIQVLFTSMCTIKLLTGLLNSSLCFCLLHQIKSQSQNAPNIYFALLSSSTFLSFTIASILCDFFRVNIKKNLKFSILLAIWFLATFSIALGNLQFSLYNRIWIFFLLGAAFSATEAVSSEIISQLYPPSLMSSKFSQGETSYLIGTILGYAIYAVRMHRIPFDYLHVFTLVGILLLWLSFPLLLFLTKNANLKEQETNSSIKSEEKEANNRWNYLYFATACINGFSYTFTSLVLMLSFDANAFILAVMISSLLLSAAKFSTHQTDSDKQLNVLLIVSAIMGVLKIVFSVGYSYVSNFAEISFLVMALGYVQNAICLVASIQYSMSFVGFAKENQRLSFMASLSGYGNAMGAFMANLLYSCQMSCAFVFALIGAMLLAVVYSKRIMDGGEGKLNVVDVVEVVEVVEVVGGKDGMNNRNKDE